MATPPISSVALLAAPAHDRAMLLDIHDLLNKIFIRNRNQHRRCSWWKSLHAFRKQLALLLQDMDISKKTDREAKVQARLRYWDTKLIHNWYFRFSQLLSSGPFAALAQVLMGCIARVCRISGITKTYEEIASAELKAILTASDEISMADRYGGVLGDDGQDWDEGVVIMREDEDEDDAE